MVKAVGYIRVSQEDEKPENQRIQILEWARRNSFDVVGFFVDEAVSGATPPRERPQYKAMLEFCKNNGVNNIIFYDISRLGRNLEETLYELKTLLEEGYNTYFVYPDFLNQINDPMMKKFVVSMLAWFAELYRYDIIQRTKAGMERAKREGKRIGRPPAVPEEFLIKIIRKYPGLSKKDLWRLTIAEGYKISYPRFVRKVNEIIRKIKRR